MLERSQSRDPGAASALHPIVPTAGESTIWAGATWIGEIDHAELPEADTRLVDGSRFGRARFLVWKDDQPQGFVELPVHSGSIDGGALREQAQKLPEPPRNPPGLLRPPISIVICTRDRPDHLTNVLSSLYRLDYPQFEVVLVDNNPASGLTPPVVEAFSDLPIRLVDAVGQGLSIARNVGAQNARYNLIAYTDDDVVLDRRWLTHIANGFARDERVACVCGMVPTSEVLTPAQAYFDHRVSWAKRWAPALYSMKDQLADDGLFPLRVSEFGTGANFAVRRDVVVALGGFDEALGAGSPAGSGEDVDIFVRVLLAGHLLAREPSAIVWHSHRKTVRELESQMYNYGVGLTAWIFKLLLQRRTFALVLRRILTGLRHLRQVTVVDHDAATAAEPALKDVYRREFSGFTHGPWALMRGRLAGRKAAPLRTASSRLGRIFDVRRGRMWGDTGSSMVSARLAAAAIAAGLVGTAGAVESLSPALRVVVVAAFILSGPGCLAMSYYGHLPRYAVIALIPVVGMAICIVVVTGLLMLGLYGPRAVLLVLTLTTVLGAVLRWAQLGSPGRQRT